ncbi:MAG TPA: D-glycerate dehydrogenase [Candidatus Dormibacteraeota bacterium]|nr:D-glycerate dehydrogenase [Candidatus Dormibacteraeota bacterium]
MPAKPKIFLTRPLFDPARLMLNDHFEVEYWTPPERISRDELLSSVQGKEALICLLTEKINDELLAAAPKLRIVANVAVGFDNIDVPACTRKGVVVSNTPGVLDETTADFAWTLLMSVARRVVEGDSLARSGNWKGWDLDQLCGTDVWGKTLGILGFGRIGRAVARRARGFKMRAIYHDAVRVAPEIEAELGAQFAEFNQVLSESDFLSLHVPLLPETRHLISSPQLARMKRGAFLINTSRGPVVDEAALVAALESGKLAGAAIDVFENEPYIHSGLRRPNVVLAPHIASASLETRTKMACIAAENVIALFQGRTPPNALNPEVLKSHGASGS